MGMTYLVFPVKKVDGIPLKQLTINSHTTENVPLSYIELSAAKQE
jgi:hypothetical protein